MRATRALFVCLALSTGFLHAQQKAFDWVPQDQNSIRIGPGSHSGVAIYEPHGWEALHVRLEIVSRQPVSVGVVRKEDWDQAVRNARRLEHLDYACLTEGVTRVNFSCNFYPSDIARMVVVRDSRRTESPVVSGIAAPFVRSESRQVFDNDVHVMPYHWECVSHCDQPDPPQAGWVHLSSEKYQLTSALRSFGPFLLAGEDEEVHVQVRSEAPINIAVLTQSQADELSLHRDHAREVLARSACRETAIQSGKLDCTFHKSDGALQVVALPESEIRKKKTAEISISAIECVANCKK